MAVDRRAPRAQRDIFPTGWDATELVGVQPGESVVVYGGGPVGLLAAYSATLKSAAKVMLVDRQSDRLKLAEAFSVIPIDDSKDSLVDEIREQPGGDGADCGCEAVGYQLMTTKVTKCRLTMNNMVASVKATGDIVVAGVFIPEDPGAQDGLAKQGQIAFDFGSFSRTSSLSLRRPTRIRISTTATRADPQARRLTRHF